MSLSAGRVGGASARKKRGGGSPGVTLNSAVRTEPRSFWKCLVETLAGHITRVEKQVGEGGVTAAQRGAPLDPGLAPEAQLAAQGRPGTGGRRRGGARPLVTTAPGNVRGGRGLPALHARPPGLSFSPVRWGPRAGGGRDLGRESQARGFLTRLTLREVGREGPEEGVVTGKGDPRGDAIWTSVERGQRPGLAEGGARATSLGAHSRALSAAPGIAALGVGVGAARPHATPQPWSPPRSSGYGLSDSRPLFWGARARTGQSPAADPR